MNQGVGLQPLYNFPVILYYLLYNSMNPASTTKNCNKNTNITSSNFTTITNIIIITPIIIVTQL